MQNPLDLDRYFDRIGYRGPRAPTLDVLREIQCRHAHAVPFENLDPLTGRRVSLELAAVVDKLVERRRGGYCFEQNRLLAHVLMQLGFQVTRPQQLQQRSARIGVGYDAIGGNLVTMAEPHTARAPILDENLSDGRGAADLRSRDPVTS